MALHNKLGEIGENLALEFLKSKNYQIIEKNWRYKHLEADIIARDGNFLVFVEVKTRSKKWELNTLISDEKIKNLRELAQNYVEKKNFELEVRFDLLVINKVGTKFFFNLIKDAFI